jgi:predicted methyltransferase
MTILQISEKLAWEIQTEAKERGLAVEAFLQKSLQRERTLANRRKIEQEQAWWFHLPLSKRARYEGEFVAIHNQQVIDHSKNENALHKRIRTKYGKTPILIMPAEGPKNINIYSPRLIRQ